MSDTLINACNALDAFAQAILASHPQDQTYLEIWGWNCPAITRHDLARSATSLASRMRELSPKQVDSELNENLGVVPQRLQLVQNTTLQYLGNGNAAGAIPVIEDTIKWIASFVVPYLPPILDWQDVDEQELMPKALLRRLRSVDTQISNLEAKSGDIRSAVESIMEAHAAAEALPTDIASLEDARKAVEADRKLANESRVKATSAEKGAVEASEKIRSLEKEAQKLVENCESALSAATSKGLGEAFALRAKSLADSMWIWVVGLLLALLAGGILGHNKVAALQILMSKPNPNINLVWINFFLAFLSIAAPTWFAWLATKQIGQRFRLSEDYAFKASVAQAYAGYSREAARVDPKFAAQLFGSALNRIDEAPLRFVENENHGSPIHELTKSIIARKQKTEKPVQPIEPSVEDQQ